MNKASRERWNKFNWKRWEEIYAEWKYWNPEVDKIGREKARRGCAGKYVFHNFWDALVCVSAMERAFDDNKKFNIYECPVCHLAHIGRNRMKVEL